MYFEWILNVQTEHYKLAYQVWVLGFTSALNETSFMEGLMKWSSRYALLWSRVDQWTLEGPVGGWWNQNGCYGNHAIANVSENVFDLDWWNLALPRFDYISHVNRGGLVHGQLTCFDSYYLVVYFSPLTVISLFLTQSHLSFRMPEHHIEFRSRSAPWLQGPSAHIPNTVEYLHGRLTRTKEFSPTQRSQSDSNVSFREESAVHKRRAGFNEVSGCPWTFYFLSSCSVENIYRLWQNLCCPVLN